MDELRGAFEERAAIAQYCGGLTRVAAERLARERVWFPAWKKGMGTTRVTKIVAERVKGQSFALDLSRPTLLIGPSRSGKSARAIAAHLALKRRVGGSTVPAELGDLACDVGTVELSLEGTCDLGEWKLTRILGERHEARLQVAGDYAKTPSKVEELLAQLFGHQRGEPTALDEFVAANDAQQARLVAALGAKADPAAAAAKLRAMLTAEEVRWVDARGIEHAASLGDDVGAVVERYEADGLEAVREAARGEKNAAAARKQAADKTRSSLVGLAATPPSGSLPELRAEVERIDAARRALAGRRGAREAALREAEAIQGRIRRADDALRRAQDEVGRADANVADLEEKAARVPAIRSQLEAAQARVADFGARFTKDEAQCVAHSEAASEAEGQARVLQAGSCPTCKTKGASVAAAAADSARTAARSRVLARRIEERLAGVHAELAAARESEKAHKAALDTLAYGLAGMDGARERAKAVRRQHEEAERELAQARAVPVPAAPAEGDLEAEARDLDAQHTAASCRLEALVTWEAGEASRRAVEEQIDAALAETARWAAIGTILDRFSIELTRESFDAVASEVNRVLVQIYRDGTQFAFRPGDGWGIGLAGGGAPWRPYGALSAGERAVLAVCFAVAALVLARRPFRFINIDNLDRMNRDEAIALVRALSVEMAEGRLSNVLCAWRTEADAAGGLGTDLAGSNVQVVALGAPRGGSPAVAADERGTVLRQVLRAAGGAA